ncbi:MAG TPA: hypothetical protein VNH22_14085 [Blastocatellia bacterium]|jgi:predicted NBD/HSP70 family sugar kinase|nr:hypothetical protein [Blastocatellia bacterium]
MNDHKYVALDIHQSRIVLLVVDQTGKQLKQSIIETRADTVIDFFIGALKDMQVMIGTVTMILAQPISGVVEEKL